MKKLLLILLCLPIIGFGQCIPSDGCNNGIATYNWTNGDNYVGNWKDGLFHGQGTYTFANGEKFKGADHVYRQAVTSAGTGWCGSICS